jgi:hypothetical protein
VGVTSLNDMSVVINLRGTGGSGKSSAVYHLMKKFGVRSNIKNNGRIVGHRLNQDIMIVGKYETNCGGCDQIKTQDDICKRVSKFAEKGSIVVFEGLLISGLYSRYLDLSRKLVNAGHRFIWAFLDTPLETCIRRTIARRKSVGNVKPFNPANTELKYRAVELAHLHALEDNEVVVMLDGDAAGEQLWSMVLYFVERSDWRWRIENSR